MEIDQNAIENYKKGVGMMMACSKVIYDSALKVGFSEEQALMMATAYMTNTVTETRNEVKE